MKLKEILVIGLLILTSCKSSDKLNSEFKRDIKSYYQENEICFRVDKSMKVGTFGMNLLALDSIDRDEEWKLKESFSSGNGCRFVVLTDRLNDSIIVGAVYPYKPDIEPSLDVYTNWFYQGKIFIKTNSGRKSKIDTISVMHNPPISNPRTEPETID